MRLIFNVLFYTIRPKHITYILHTFADALNITLYFDASGDQHLYRTKYDPIHWGLYEKIKMNLYVVLLYSVLLCIGIRHGVENKWKLACICPITFHLDDLNERHI